MLFYIVGFEGSSLKVSDLCSVSWHFYCCNTSEFTVLRFKGLRFKLVEGFTCFVLGSRLVVKVLVELQALKATSGKEEGPFGVRFGVDFCYRPDSAGFQLSVGS